MKTKYNMLSRISLSSGLAVALAFGLWLPGAVRAETELKGAERTRQMQGLNTKAQAEALKPGDSIAMVCTKCKSVAVEYVHLEQGHIKQLMPGEKHLCPGCEGTIEIVGHGQDKHAVLKHNCSKCGDESAFCCATKPGEGTKGMEKK